MSQFGFRDCYSISIASLFMVNPVFLAWFECSLICYLLRNIIHRVESTAFRSLITCLKCEHGPQQESTNVKCFNNKKTDSRMYSLVFNYRYNLVIWTYVNSVQTTFSKQPLVINNYNIMTNNALLQLEQTRANIQWHL